MRRLVPIATALVLPLAACDSAADDATTATYETDVVDESGGELIVADPDAPAVEDVDVPETEMTNVPPGEADAADGAAGAAGE